MLKLAAAAGSDREAWSFAANADGSYRITNASTGQLLGGASTSKTTRAWGTAPTVTFWQYADSGTFPGDQDCFNGPLSGPQNLATNT